MHVNVSFNDLTVPSATFRVLPTDGIYLPRFVEVFFHRVAKAAHDFVHINDGSTFDLSKFNKDCRQLLYNTERNIQRRETAEKKSVAEPRPSLIPQTVKPGCDDDDVGEEEEEGDEFFTFKRSEKATARGDASPKKHVTTEKKTVGSGDEEGDEDVPAMSQSEVDSGKKRKRSPDNEPVSKRPAAYLARASVLDHLKSVLEDGMPVDDVLKLLRAYVKSLGHRKGYILACKDLKLFIREIEENGGEDDILDIAANYNIALSKLPAILE